MATRAAVCIGVNRPGSMPPLSGAALGASEFADWARAQGCDTTLLTDDANRTVTLAEVEDAIFKVVEAGTYEQLYVYFSGHGFLKAPEAEYWLLSRAPERPGEAVNLGLSITYARGCPIPHIVFISDACRSIADAKLMPVTGQTIFPYKRSPPPRPVVDTFYATQPGDTSYEATLDETDLRIAGLFTDCLLKRIVEPESALLDPLAGSSPPVSVVLSRKLKVLESEVPIKAASIHIRMRQTPEVRSESYLPQFFARIVPGAARGAAAVAPPPPPPPAVAAPQAAPAPPRPIGTVVAEVAESTLWKAAAPPAGSDAATLAQEIDELAGKRGRTHFETMTGLSVHGADVREVRTSAWQRNIFPDSTDPGVTHVRLSGGVPPETGKGGSVLLRLGPDLWTVLAVIPGFIATVVADAGRIVTVSYVPSDIVSDAPWRYQEYQRNAKDLDRMRAFAAVASRHGQFVVTGERAEKLANELRSMKYLDPTLGVYAAYAYAQAGIFEQTLSIFQYMVQDSVAIPFDVAMLAARVDPLVPAAASRFAPFCPMLTQGWSLLDERNPLHTDLHRQLASHLRPSLWTSLDEGGAALVREAFDKGDIR
jgi:hypothetical protein